MKYELPPLSSKEGLSFEHFPTRMQCFIFRNWEMIEPETLGKVLGCDEKTVLALAGDMGLPVPPQTDPDWLTKGYITVIRANWHLCTCEQIGDCAALQASAEPGTARVRVVGSSPT